MIDETLRSTIIHKYLTNEAKTILVTDDWATADDYKMMNALILQTYKLTPGKYRETFYKVTKKPKETL